MDLNNTYYYQKIIKYQALIKIPVIILFFEELSSVESIIVKRR